MAVTKIKPIKGTLNKALDYIQNPAKTDEKMLVSSFGCSYETADIEFAFTLSQALDKPRNTLRLAGGKARFGKPHLPVAPGHKTGAPFHAGVEAVPAPIRIAAHISDLLLCKVNDSGITGARSVYKVHAA